jgi:hypothetical protein
MIARKACLPLTLIICLVAISGCLANNKISGDSLPADKYVAVQEDLSTSCTLIEGSYNLPPHITLPPLPFFYDGSANGSNWASRTSWKNAYPQLNNNYYPAVNDSFKVLYGTIYYRDIAPRDTRTGMRIRGVYGLPYACESGFVLQNIDRNGTIYGSYDNTSIVLRIGEQWTSPVFTEIKSGNGTGMDQKPFSYTANFNTTWTITNLGIFDKANLTRYNNSITATGYKEVFSGADPMEK